MYYKCSSSKCNAMLALHRLNKLWITFDTFCVFFSSICLIPGYKGNIEVEGKQNPLFVSSWSSHWVFCCTSQLKSRKKVLYVGFLRFQKVRTDHVRVQSSHVFVSQGSKWVLTYDTWHVLLQSEKVFQLGGMTTRFADPRSTRVINDTAFSISLWCSSP